MGGLFAEKEAQGAERSNLRLRPVLVEFLD